MMGKLENSAFWMPSGVVDKSKEWHEGSKSKQKIIWYVNYWFINIFLSWHE